MRVERSASFGDLVPHTKDSQGDSIPLLVRRGGCGIKKISAKPTLAPQTGWSPSPKRGLRATNPAAVAATPPHEEGNRPPRNIGRGPNIRTDSQACHELMNPLQTFIQLLH